MRPRTGTLLVAGLLGSIACQSERVTGPLPEFATALPVTYNNLHAGQYHSCISRDAARRCWGLNVDGQIGNGTVTNFWLTSQPVTNTTGSTFTLADGGYDHTCSLSGSRAYCWGRNSNGELGNGTTNGSSTPVLVAGGIAWKAIATGAHHTCGISTSRVAYCWGYNGAGQLGDGTLTGQTFPRGVSTSRFFDNIVAGEHFTCAWPNSTLEGGTYGSDVWCWGDNSRGQLGTGSTAARYTRPNDPVRGIQKWLHVTAGAHFACAATGFAESVGYEVYCWGDNQFGQLGLCGSGPFECLPPGGFNRTPFQVSGPADNKNLRLRLRPIAAGYGHVCGRRIETGLMYCWGLNGDGQLGNGTFGNQLNPTPVSGNFAYQEKLAAGGFHTMAVRSDGAVVTWGRNWEGQLGNGTQNGSAIPIAINP